MNEQYQQFIKSDEKLLWSHTVVYPRSLAALICFTILPGILLAILGYFAFITRDDLLLEALPYFAGPAIAAMLGGLYFYSDKSIHFMLTDRAIIQVNGNKQMRFAFEDIRDLKIFPSTNNMTSYMFLPTYKDFGPDTITYNTFHTVYGDRFTVPRTDIPYRMQRKHLRSRLVWGIAPIHIVVDQNQYVELNNALARAGRFNLNAKQIKIDDDAAGTQPHQMVATSYDIYAFSFAVSFICAHIITIYPLVEHINFIISLVSCFVVCIIIEKRYQIISAILEKFPNLLVMLKLRRRFNPFSKN